MAASVTGIDPHREPKVSMLATQMRQGTLTSLYRATNAIILGDRLAEKIGARVGSNITVQTSDGASARTPRWSGMFRIRRPLGRREHRLRADEDRARSWPSRPGW